MKILLATDGSAHSKAAVEEVARIPFPLNSKVRIVSANESVPRIMTIDPIGVSKEYYAAAHHDALKVAGNASENAVNVLRNKNPSLTITTSVIEGSPKSIILKVAERFGADWITVGSHGQGAIERFLLSSVSQAVALHAKCSVLVVRKQEIKSEQNKKKSEDLPENKHRNWIRKVLRQLIIIISKR